MIFTDHFFQKQVQPPPLGKTRFTHTDGHTYRLMVITLSVWYTALRATTRLKRKTLSLSGVWRAESRWTATNSVPQDGQRSEGQQNVQGKWIVHFYFTTSPMAQNMGFHLRNNCLPRKVNQAWAGEPNFWKFGSYLLGFPGKQRHCVQMQAHDLGGKIEFEQKMHVWEVHWHFPAQWQSEPPVHSTLSLASWVQVADWVTSIGRQWQIKSIFVVAVTLNQRDLSNQHAFLSRTQFMFLLVKLAGGQRWCQEFLRNKNGNGMNWWGTELKQSATLWAVFGWNWTWYWELMTSPRHHWRRSSLEIRIRTANCMRNLVCIICHKFATDSEARTFCERTVLIFIWQRKCPNIWQAWENLLLKLNNNHLNLKFPQECKEE